MNKLHARTVYLILSVASPFLGSTIWVVGAVYYVLSVHMNPLQLVLVGTTLEISYFLFQVPTGLFADTVSRRLSVIIGTFVCGACWLFQGLVPLFAAVVLAEAVRGAGEAFIDGAESAWLSDEVGEEQFGRLVLRGSQLASAGGMVGTLAGVALASIRLNLPIALGGVLLMALGLFLALAMPEHGFRPAALGNPTHRQVMGSTLRRGLRMVRAQSLLLIILGIAVVFGAFSEGYDRLWEAHYLKDFTFPRLDHLKPVVWFGIINLLTGFLNIGATQVLHRRLDMNSHTAVTRSLFAVNALLIAGVLVFGLAGSFALALGAFCVTSVAKGVYRPIYATWLNRNITDSSVRATVLSLSGQADAFGQFVGGPVIGVVGTVFSLRAAITIGGLILSPVLPLYAWALRHGGDASTLPEEAPQPV